MIVITVAIVMLGVECFDELAEVTLILNANMDLLDTGLLLTQMVQVGIWYVVYSIGPRVWGLGFGI